ncbi:hypothetical protein [Virgibacillus salexigens]|uniref:Uncharacterized protein n=1 Tax=Virgibacillus kapii TaxID=1638645 RepID=A0ABQ2D9H7_9BACI|nr:hypothetical protein [Virgibacillus kapii]GGJ49610.1 hypothetical protein GCM10007111_09700 [Virgibacillus kapii]
MSDYEYRLQLLKERLSDPDIDITRDDYKEAVFLMEKLKTIKAEIAHNQIKRIIIRNGL